MTICSPIAEVAAGSTIARVPSAATDHEKRVRQVTRAKAQRYLDRTGNGDLLDMLGLVDPPARPGRRIAVPDAPLPARTCPVCGEQYTPANPRSKTCGKSCGARLGAKTKAAQP